MKRIALVGLTVLLVLVGTSLWLASGERAARTPARGITISRPTPPDAAPAELLAPGEAATPLPVQPSDGRGARTDAADDRPRIAGSVLVLGRPPRERAHVVAEIVIDDAHGERTTRERVPIARDGAFELRVPHDTRLARLDVESELLLLPQPIEARPGATGVLLAPQLLAVLHGRVLPPPETDVELGSVRLKLSPDGIQPPGQLWPLATRPSTDGAYRLERVPTGVELGLAATNPLGIPWSVRLEPLAPGERRELVIALDAGIRIAGRVVDEHGVPVEGASVWVSDPAESLRLFGRDGQHDVPSDADGRFELTRLARARHRVEARHSLMSEGEVVVDGSRGDVLDVVVTLVRGGCVTGTVEWPDGDLAESFFLHAREGDRPTDVHQPAPGRFEQCGFREGAYTLSVRAKRDGEVGEARVEGVHAGQTLRIVLETRPTFTIRGTAADASARPLRSFHVRASSRRGSANTRASKGAFELPGLEPGEWELEVGATDCFTERRRIEVGPSTPQLDFVLRAAGRIRGTVLDPSGSPARAELWIAGMDRFRREPPSTDDEGRFDVAPPASRVLLHAFADGYAPSEPVELAVASGETLDGVVLRLRELCRLEGRVLAADGRPAPAAVVVLRDGGDSTTANEHGEFVLERLSPGPLALIARHEDAWLHHSVVLADGTTSIELRFEPSDPVLVRGVAVRAGAPFTGTLSFSSLSGRASARSGPDGRFEVTLRRPGDWRVGTWADGFGQGGPYLMLELSIPDVETHELALDLDAMRAPVPVEGIHY